MYFYLCYENPDINKDVPDNIHIESVDKLEIISYISSKESRVIFS